jgi:hypothetical protein
VVLGVAPFPPTATDDDDGPGVDDADREGSEKSRD